MLKEKIIAVCGLLDGVASAAQEIKKVTGGLAADMLDISDDDMKSLDALPCVDIVTPVGIYMVSVHCSVTYHNDIIIHATHATLYKKSYYMAMQSIPEFHGHARRMCWK